MALRPSGSKSYGSSSTTFPVPEQPEIKLKPAKTFYSTLEISCVFRVTTTNLLGSDERHDR